MACACEGFLLKLGDNSRLIKLGLKGFELRYCTLTLTPTPTIRYYKSKPMREDDAAALRGIIRLADVVGLRSSDPRLAKGPFAPFKAFGFTVHVRGRGYRFMAQNDAEFEQWVADIAKYVNPSRCRLAEDTVGSIARQQQEWPDTPALVSVPPAARARNAAADDDSDASGDEDVPRSVLVTQAVAAREAAARAELQAEVDRLKTELAAAQSRIMVLERKNRDLRQTVRMRDVSAASVPVGMLLTPLPGSSPRRKRGPAASNDTSTSVESTSTLEEPLLQAASSPVVIATTSSLNADDEPGAKAEPAAEASTCRCVVS